MRVACLPGEEINCGIVRTSSGGIEAAATIGGAEHDAMQSALTEKLRMPKAPQPAAEMAFDRPVMIAALFVVQDAPTPG